MRISDTEMTSDRTRHTAQAAAAGGWTVSWLPGRVLTQNQAVTAMTIAEAVVAHVDDLADNGGRWWPHIDQWAAELGITGPEAVAMSSLSPEDHASTPEVVTTALDSQPRRRGYLLGLDEGTGTARVRIGGETVTMPAAHLQYAGGEPVQEDADAPADRPALIDVMTDHERSVLLAYIAGRAPEVFDAAVADRTEAFAAELAGRIDAREEAEYLAEPAGYCTVCGANVSWFIGYEGPQHFRGPYKLVTGAERRELFDPGHEPAVDWRESAAGPSGLRGSEDQGCEACPVVIVHGNLTFGAGCPSVSPSGKPCTVHDGSGDHGDGSGERWPDPANPLCLVCGQAPATKDGLCEIDAYDETDHEQDD